MTTETTDPAAKMTNELPRGIVVGYDDSAEAASAMRWAIARAKASSSQLAVVFVMPVVYTPGLAAAGLAPNAFMPTDEEMRTYPGVVEAIKELGADQVSVIARVGVPAAELLELSCEAELLVVGSRGRGALAASLFGSTAYALAGRAECPVVVVRGDEGAAPLFPSAEHPIVVAIEDEEISAEPMELAAQAAERSGATLRLVRATVSAVAGDWATPFGDSQLSIEQAMSSSDIADLQACADILTKQHPGITVEQVHQVGDPGTIITDAAKDAALIIMGSRGRGGFASLVLGSVSHSVIQHAECPVEIVRTNKR